MQAAYRHAWVTRARKVCPMATLRWIGRETQLRYNRDLSLMLDQWRDIFGRVLGRTEYRIVHRIRDARNDFAHQQEITLDRAIGVFEDIESLLKLSAPESTQRPSAN